ncbi:hypothetical protein NF212_21110 [Parasalinivibrio latis]|uniref:hypothetical protein n=1 Tax=Parasalinivibrio latis TaxID=2952610 RepID=UPI0030DF1253
MRLIRLFSSDLWYVLPSSINGMTQNMDAMQDVVENVKVNASTTQGNIRQLQQINESLDRLISDLIVT